MDNAGSLRVNQGTPESILARVGDLHSSDIILLLILITGLGIATYFFLVWRNNRKPPEERRSNFALFLIALNVGFFATVMFFVYRVVIIGLEYLFSK